ncbi:hypothetical protein C2845_PM12G14220 [Panicum miliaceum]|uniref:Uncharacterized protein n=1 Tax=Panicum miliaceum TaxID=4540 RepID=A0A3L6QCE1_PANMI|nr:hypothetical protein C2845_PM12G14220 [Panicum miliaceum]
MKTHSPHIQQYASLPISILVRILVIIAARPHVIPFAAELAGFLDKRGGRLRETVETVTMDTDNEEMKGLGALHLAAGNGKLEMCRHLVEGLLMDVDIVDSSGRTPLVNAIHGKSVDAVKYLLEHGANQDKVDRYGFSPLHVAAGLGCCEIVELLLARGAYTDPVTCCGTPLHIAATEGQDCTMKILLNHNADYNKMVNGMTPLYFAVNAASVKCVRLLVQPSILSATYTMTVNWTVQ